MPHVDRRTFLKGAATAIGAGLAVRFTPSTWAQANGANGDIRVAVIGLYRKGAEHITHLLTLPGVRVVAVCDVDPLILAREVERLKQQQIKVFAATDARHILARSDVDAVVIATSNHWHALLTIWACQAGKDVYVEKPVSHNIWEGRRMVEAAEKYQRVVQTGTQYRSDTGFPEAIDWVQAQNLGPIQAVHTVCYKLREPIGQRLPWFPAWLDYDLFCGPAAPEPLRRERLDYDWHWVWSTGNAEIGNNGVHVLDISRRFARHDRLPRRVISLGGRFACEDAAETPNTSLTVFDYDDGVPVIFESRGLSAEPGVRYTDVFYGTRENNGVAVFCADGYYSGYTGGAAYDYDGNQIRRFSGDGGGEHMNNFLAAVRNRRPADLRAPIITGHESTTLSHFGNISYRLGRPGTLAQARAKLESFPAAIRALEGIEQHLAKHGVDLHTTPFTVGPWVEIDARHETVARVEDGGEDALAQARGMIRETQRPAYAVPEHV